MRVGVMAWPKTGLLLAAAATAGGAMAATIRVQNAPFPISQPPVVLWHGLGDSYDSDGIVRTVALLEKTNPGTYVHVVRLEDSGFFGSTGLETEKVLGSLPFGGSSRDKAATMFGNTTKQLEEVCDQLSSDPVLSRVSRINGLGFSQGGLFLRALVQECDFFAERVYSLVTFGSPHNGMTGVGVDLCPPSDGLCQRAVGFVKSHAWTDWTQGHVVPAQYYRPVVDRNGNETGEAVPKDDYLKQSGLLARLNNEKDCYPTANDDKTGSKASPVSKCSTNQKYASRFRRSLRHLAMFSFDNDTVLLPAVSAWGAASSSIEPGSDGRIPNDTVPLQHRKIWTDDTIGLRGWAEQTGSKNGVAMLGRWNSEVPILIGGSGEPIRPGREMKHKPDEADGKSAGIGDLLPQPSRLPAVVLGSLPGDHMQISEDDLKAVASAFFGLVISFPQSARDEL